MKILAFDSGIELTGYALFASESNEKRVTLSDYGCIKTERSEDLTHRMYELHTALHRMIQKLMPDRIVFERLYFNTNQKTVIQVAQTQGILLSIAGKYSISCDTLTPTQIKHILTGYGRSDKKSVQKMLKMLLKMDVTPKPDDVTDAIACGYSYSVINNLI